jgi:hypothetical protein
MFPNLSEVTEENHVKAVVVPAEIRNTDLSNLNQNSRFATWDNLLGPTEKKKEEERKLDLPSIAYSLQ